MQKINTADLLATLEQQTNTLLDAAIQKWQIMPGEQFSFQPSPGQWSAKQCFAHLNSYGNYYLPAIEKAIKKARLNEKLPAHYFFPGWLGNYFTHVMQPGANGIPVKKMKAFKKYIHPNNENGYTVMADFIDQQEKILSLLEAARAVNLNSTRTGISIAPIISLKLGDTLQFIIAHNHRHIRQAERAAAAAIIIKPITNTYGQE
ncbi:MAG: DinB family protein [Chitinophagaceae bacterium]